MRTKRWDQLHNKDRIVCPRDELPETVTAARKYVGGRWFVRTSRHDHFRPREQRVKIVPGGQL